MELILASRTSPGLTNVPVVEPTPEGVPVEIMSPGSSVTKLEMNSMTAATGKICCAVEASWRISSFSVNRSSRDWGSAMADAEVMQGPQGHPVSCHFPCSQSKKLSLLRSFRFGLASCSSSFCQHAFLRFGLLSIWRRGLRPRNELARERKHGMSFVCGLGLQKSQIC